MIYLILIFHLSSQQVGQLGGLAGLNYNSILHVFEYFGLSILTYRLFNHFQFSRPAVKSVLFSILYGITDEFHQALTPTRVFSVYDMLLNTVGSLLLFLVLKSKTLPKLLQ